ncbi:MAG: AAA family ATPase [Candidatus Woesearchaeota archaeon]|jgi:DNA repair exonuclease SbcCD ATPase subunit|nr:AAA family ATPase [Candidatus Woesearchaeota archaeon]
MIIRKLEMTNFKSKLGYVEYEYEEGINILIGGNGSGKSTQIDGISLLLLGIKSAKTLQELINDKAKDTFFEISCTFEKDSNVYTSEMRLDLIGKTAKSNRKLYINDELAVEGSESTLQALAEILDPVLVDNALFLRQNHNNIVNITDSTRRDLIKQVKGVDYTSKVKKEVEPEIERIKLDIIEVDKRIFALESRTYDPKIVKELPFFETKYKEYVEDKEKLSSELILLRDKLSEKESKELECDKLTATITYNNCETSEAKAGIVDYRDQIETNNKLRITDKESTTNKLKDLKCQSTRLESAYGLEEEDLQYNHREEKEEIEGSIDNLESTLLLYPTKRIAKFDSSTLDHYNKECTSIESDIKSLKKSIENMENGKCPTCGRDYEASTIEEYKTELEIKESELFEAESISAKLRVEKDEHEEKVETNNTNSNKKVEINNKLSNEKAKLSNLDIQLEKDLKEALTRIDKEILNNKESITLHEEKLANIDVVYDSKNSTLDGRIKSLEKSIVDFTTNNISLEAKKSKLELEIVSYNIETIEDKEKALILVSSKVKDYEDILSENKTIKQDNKDLIIKERADKKELTKETKTKDKLKTNLLEHETARSILLKGFPNYIISKSIGKLEDDMNHTIDEIYDKSLNITFKQKKGAIELKYGNKENLKTAKGGLSGAEGSITNLAFVNSFNKAIDLGAIILDEVDASLSDENAESLYESIGNMSEAYEQLIVVTHKDKLNSYLINNFEANTLAL